MRNSAPLFTPRLDWLVFLVTVGFSLTLLFFGRGKAMVTVKQELGGVFVQLARPVVYVRRTFDLWRENAALHEQAMILSRENAELRNRALENARLRAMLGFQERSPLPLRSADVLGFPGPGIGGRIVIGAGRRAGVRVNSAVLTPDGLVGKVIEVSDFTALVQTLVGNAYGVSVMIERSRVGGILKWLGPGRWTIVGLSTGEDVRVGDLVLTTGFGSVFPKGVRVGVVSEVTAPGVPGAGWCRVQPFVRYESLEEVFVVAAVPGASRTTDSLFAGAHP
jgi:rod shape-determining protein MreC